MSRFDLGNNIRKPKTVPATVEGFYERVDKAGRICAELADMLEQHQRGELTKDEYKAKKAEVKLGDAFYTPHAHFAKGYKSNEGEPVDSGKAIIDLDGCPNFAEIYARHLMGRERELGINMVNRSVSGTGGHVLFDIPEGLDRQQAQAWLSHEMGDVEYDKAVHELERAIYLPCREYILYIDEDLMFGDELHPAKLTEEELRKYGTKETRIQGAMESVNPQDTPQDSPKSFPTHYHGIPFEAILKKYWEVNNRGFEPTEGDRDTLTYQLACDLRHICGRNFQWLDQVIPCYDGFPLEEKRQKIKSALSSEFNGFPLRLRNTLNALEMEDGRCLMEDVEHVSDTEDEQLSTFNSQLLTRKMPQGIRESIDAVGPQFAMPVVTAICPCIGALATGVVLDVHGKKTGLNLISYIAGDFASGKGNIDPVVWAWMSEVKALDKIYIDQEDEWRLKKRAAKNKKDQPEEPKLPVRCITLNNTVANIAERLANTEGKHAFSFTPEADTVSQKWKQSVSDFSVMLRQSYDGSRYDREAKSVDAVNVHIDHLLWCVCMCGTPDALYRVVRNYTDGLQSRIAVARTPDNTFAPLEDKPYVLNDRQRERIQQVAHLLPLMQGEVVLPKLEQRGRAWLEKIRLETMKNDDRTRARQRIRICITAQRMTCCLMLCKVCEGLIQKHGLNGAETKLKQQPGLWRELLLKAQTPAMLEAYDVIADSLMENALFFFRDRIENAFASRDYAGYLSGDRQKRGKNDSIYERLDPQFSFEQAMQQSVAVKGASVNQNTVRQMLKNWRKQGLVVQTDEGKYRKVNG